MKEKILKIILKLPGILIVLLTTYYLFMYGFFLPTFVCVISILFLCLFKFGFYSKVLSILCIVSISVLYELTIFENVEELKYPKLISITRLTYICDEPEGYVEKDGKSHYIDCSGCVISPNDPKLALLW